MVEALCLFFPPLVSVFITVNDRIFDPAYEMGRFILHMLFLFIVFSISNTIISLTIVKLLLPPGPTFVQGHLAEPFISIKYLCVAIFVAIVSGIAGYVFLYYGKIKIKKRPRNNHNIS